MTFIAPHIELVISLSLLINAAAFILFIIRSFKEKSVRSISLLTLLSILLIQLSLGYYGLIVQSACLLGSSAFSIVLNVILISLLLFYKKHQQFALENIIAEMPGNVYWMDRKGIYLGCNNTQAKLIGFRSPREIIGKRNIDMPGFLIAEVLDPINEKVMSTGQPIVIEELGILPSGKMGCFLSNKVPLRNEKNQVIGLLGVSIDITDAKQAIQDKLDFLEDIIAEMPGNVYWIDRNGIYVGCNNNAAKALNLKSRKDIVGKRNIDLEGVLDSEEIDKTNKTVMEEGKTLTLEEAPVLYNGKQVTFFSSKVPIKNSRGEVTGMVGISIDITDRKKIEQDLVIAKEKAETANEAKEVFLLNMRHDLRTPFSGILTLAQWMAEQETDPNKKQNLECIANSSQILLNYMNNVLEHAQQSNQIPDVLHNPFNLEKLLHESMLTMMPSAIDKKLRLTLDYPPNIPKIVKGDTWHLQRIILNLLGNAVKFTHEGEITISVNAVSQQATQIVLAISIRDTGIGIPAEKRSEIFEKFTRLEAAYEGNYQGMGLGLYDVKLLCQQLGGEVTVINNSTQGSIFTCTLPFTLAPQELAENLCDKQSSDESGHKKTSAMAMVSGLNALLVEDQPIAAYATAQLMRSRNYTIDIANSGRTALEKFTNKKYDVVLVDIGLPDMDGVSLARQLQKLAHANKRPSTPLIALTAHINSNEHDLNIFDKVFNKPFSIEALDTLCEFLANFKQN